MSQAILNPLSETTPCGSDFKYEDAYLALESEIDKSTSISEGVATDWSRVLDEAESLLSEHTKDIKIMCWWTYALYKTQTLNGLETAIPVFNSLLLNFGEQLFPKSKKVKLSSLLWLEELLHEELLDERGSISGSVDAEKFLGYFTELEKNFGASVGEELSLFKKLQSALDRLAKEQEVKEEAPKSSSSATAQTGQSELGEISSDADAASVMRSFKKSAGLLQEYYRTQDPSDIRAIRLVRLQAWLEIDTLPMHEEGKTPLNPPSQESIDRIEELMAEEAYGVALESTESLIALSPFWLDGHLLAFNILSEMGHLQAAKDVQNALVSFIKADEEILNLQFRDTTPFASVKLKKWIGESMGSAISTGAEGTSDEEAKAQIIEKAYALAKKKNIKEAMGLLQGHHGLSVTKEDKFYWRLAKAELATQFGKNDIALALLEDLKEDIDRYHLDEWNPELAGRVFSLFLGFNRTQVNVEDIHAAYSRLCKINIEHALEIKL